MWYNENLKKEFVDYHRAQVGNLYNIVFNVTAKMEQELDKDCSSFTLSEIIDLCKSFNASTVSSLNIKASLLRTYTNFCIEKNYTRDGMNHYDELSLQLMRTCINSIKGKSRFIYEDELQQIISDVSDDPRKQFIVLAPYEGLYGENVEEIGYLAPEDVFDDKVRLITGRILTISPQLSKIIHDAINMTEAMGHRGIYRELYDNGKVLKVLKTSRSADVVSYQVLQTMYEIIKKDYDIPTLGGTILRKSGFYKRLDELCSKHNGSFDQAYATIEYQRLAKRYNNNLSKAIVKREYTLYKQYE